ncbi:DUF6301 family protein [Actinomyces mediterranea]|uniref:DUF6301 family protein n=1 Tax=Actinomyces mediterranea TaxID=1871028 RepID=UPI0009704D72|nr:DUF6301 family protein [Actinomyces mediterranea]
MTDFRTLPAARCLELIHAWTNAPWPLTREQGQAIAVSVGWRASDDPENYYSDLADTEVDCGFAMFNGEPGDVEFQLTTLADRGCEANQVVCVP